MLFHKKKMICLMTLDDTTITDFSFIIWPVLQKHHEILKATGTLRTFCRTFFLVKTSRKHAYNFDSLKPHFYIVKLGFTWVYIIFLISAKKIDCGYSLEPP